jgi:hypothetical protein
MAYLGNSQYAALGASARPVKYLLIAAVCGYGMMRDGEHEYAVESENRTKNVRQKYKGRESSLIFLSYIFCPGF